MRLADPLSEFKMGATGSVVQTFHHKFHIRGSSNRASRDITVMKRKIFEKLEIDDKKKSSKIDSFVQEVYQVRKTLCCLFGDVITD